MARSVGCSRAADWRRIWFAESQSSRTAFRVLHLSGSGSGVLGRLDRNFTELEVRRAFTSLQLMTIIEENHHSFLIIEHDSMLYEDAKEMVEKVAQALKPASKEATILPHPARPA